MANPLYDELFGRHAGNPAVFLELLDGSEITYTQFLEMSAQLAHALTIKGYQPGDRIAVQVEKSVYALALYAACVQSGLVFLPLNTAYTANEIEYFVDNSGAACFVCNVARHQSLEQVISVSGTDLLTLDADGAGTLWQQAMTAPKDFPTVDRTADDLAAFLYTSGTTGRSKAAMLTQGNLLSNATALKQTWHFTKQDVLLHALPIFHNTRFVCRNQRHPGGGKQDDFPAEFRPGCDP